MRASDGCLDSPKDPNPVHCARRVSLAEEGRAGRALVVAAAWPSESFPVRLVRSLVEWGADVTVATEAGAGQNLDVAVERLTLPGARVRLRSLIRLIARTELASRSARTHVHHLAGHVEGGLGRSGVKEWYRLLPFIGRQWDNLFVPAEEEAVDYLQLFDLVAPATVMVERPLRGGRADRLRPVLRAASRVECTSEELAAQAVDGGADGGRIVVIPPPVDTLFFDSQPPPPAGDRRLRLVCSPSFHWTSGHDDLLISLRHMADDNVDVHLHLVSDGADHERLLYTVDDLGLRERVTIHHHVTRQRLRSLLREADIFVLAAVEDRPWPEVLEALASGIPIVATDLPWLRSVIDESLGVLVVPHEPTALAAACGRLALDHPRRLAAAHSARAKAMKLSGASEP